MGGWPSTSRRGGAGRSRASRPPTRASPLAHSGFQDSQGRMYLHLESLRQHPADTSNLSPGTSRAGHERRIGCFGESPAGHCPGPSKLLRTSQRNAKGTYGRWPDRPLLHRSSATRWPSFLGRAIRDRTAWTAYYILKLSMNIHRRLTMLRMDYLNGMCREYLRFPAPRPERHTPRV